MRSVHEALTRWDSVPQRLIGALLRITTHVSLFAFLLGRLCAVALAPPLVRTALLDSPLEVKSVSFMMVCTSLRHSTVRSLRIKRASDTRYGPQSISPGIRKQLRVGIYVQTEIYAYTHTYIHIHAYIHTQTCCVDGRLRCNKVEALQTDNANTAGMGRQSQPGQSCCQISKNPRVHAYTSMKVHETPEISIYLLAYLPAFLPTYLD